MDAPFFVSELNIQNFSLFKSKKFLGHFNWLSEIPKLNRWRDLLAEIKIILNLENTFYSITDSLIILEKVDTH